MKTPKVFFDKPIKSKEDKLMMLIDGIMTSSTQQARALCKLQFDTKALEAELVYHRRLQGIFNVLFGIAIGIVVVMWRVL